MDDLLFGAFMNSVVMLVQGFQEADSKTGLIGCAKVLAKEINACERECRGSRGVPDWCQTMVRARSQVKGREKGGLGGS